MAGQAALLAELHDQDYALFVCDVKCFVLLHNVGMLELSVNGVLLHYWIQGLLVHDLQHLRGIDTSALTLDQEHLSESPWTEFFEYLVIP